MGRKQKKCSSQLLYVLSYRKVDINQNRKWTQDHRAVKGFKGLSIIKINLLNFTGISGNIMQNYYLINGIATPSGLFIAQSAGTVECTDWFTAESWDRHLTSVLYMTLNNLMVRFQ